MVAPIDGRPHIILKEKGLLYIAFSTDNVSDLSRPKFLSSILEIEKDSCVK